MTTVSISQVLIIATPHIRKAVGMCLHDALVGPIQKKTRYSALSRKDRTTMQRTLAILLALLAICAGSEAAFAQTPPAGASPSGFARWMLTSGRPTQPLPSAYVKPRLRWLPAPPASEQHESITSTVIGELFSSDASDALDEFVVEDFEIIASSELPPPPQIDGCERPFAGEYAQELSPADIGPLTPLPPPPGAEFNDIVRFAAEAIEFTVPPQWSVTETNELRHVRLYITPGQFTGSADMTDGLWVSYHVNPQQESAPAALKKALEQRLRSALPEGAKVERPSLIEVGSHQAAERPFHALFRDGDRAVEVRGSHRIIATEWGIVELPARHTSAETASHIAQLLERMAIGKPLLFDDPATGATESAMAVFGTWKAERARLMFTPGGEVELEYDQSRPRQLDDTTLLRPARTLRGTYTADGDLLRITWADGSLLNLRWRYEDGALLLTDHLGRISQLARLYE